MTTPSSSQSADGPVPGGVVGSRRHRRAFWMVAFAFLTVMAFSTAPSPLYGLYRARDHFSVFMVTVESLYKKPPGSTRIFSPGARVRSNTFP